MKAGSLREIMPTVAAFVDEMREAFGVDTINAEIRRGMRGEYGFWAKENGHEIGTRFPEPKYVVTAAQMVLKEPEEEKPKHGKSR